MALPVISQMERVYFPTRRGFQDSLNYRDENSPLRGVIESKHPRDSMEINQQVNEHEPSSLKRPNERGTESATVDAYRCRFNSLQKKKEKKKETKMREEDKKKRRKRGKAWWKSTREAVDAYFRGSVR